MYYSFKAYADWIHLLVIQLLWSLNLSMATGESSKFEGVDP